MTLSLLEHFALGEEPRPGQVKVLEAIESAFNKGYQTILLEAPVGSGKSAIAMTLANWASSLGGSHILTPRKSLQDQYWEDFAGPYVRLMKGRSAYPCTYHDKERTRYLEVSKAIEAGAQVTLASGQTSCKEGPCLTSPAIRHICTEKDTKPCPYTIAMRSAQGSPTVIHNVHSFIFQGYLGENFSTRPLQVIDECHELEGIVRDFATRKITISIDSTPTENYESLTKWCIFFREFSLSMDDSLIKSSGLTKRGEFLKLVDELEDLVQYGLDKDFVIEKEVDRSRITFLFVPKNISRLMSKLLFDFGQKQVLMSGTIYSKSNFCRIHGLNEEKVCFIRIPSSIPVSNRPIYMKKEYMVDTSFANWSNNFQKLVSILQGILEKFPDCKGLIHTPSYKASAELWLALASTGRVITHDAKNFQTSLSKFYESKEPKVFLSPVCQQGVDFKGDRARFQIIVRVPYLNTSSEFIKEQIGADFSWYNHQAAVIFGQQCGRINRSDDDWGATVLIDSRFPKFLDRNKDKFPNWLLNAIIR